MNGRIITSTHEAYELPTLLSWDITYTGGVPCDCFAVTFLYDASMKEKLHLAAGFLAMEGEEVLLRGIVDEYTVNLSEEGLLATVRGRGYAARLLDNESRPVTYQAATLQEIVRCHVTPYGIYHRGVADVRAGTVYTVPAGTSQWKVLENFCETYGGFSPRFRRDGTLEAFPEQSGRTSLRIRDGDPVLSCELREDHYGVLTEVLVIDKKRRTSYSVKNSDMAERGGQCRRVLYTPGQDTWAANRYTGAYQIEKSREEEQRVTLRLPGGFSAFPGDLVELELSRVGLRGRYRVTEARDRMSPSGGATETLTLKEVL